MPALDHIHIYCADPEQSIGFYERFFDAERVGFLPTTDGRQNHFLVMGGQVLVLSEFPPGLGASDAPPMGDGATQSGFGVSHLGLNVADLDPLVRRLERAGVEVHGPAVTSGPIRYVYVSAPDGVVLELTQYVVAKHLAPALALLNALNRTVHVTRKTITSTLLRLAG